MTTALWVSRKVWLVLALDPTRGIIAPQKNTKTLEMQIKWGTAAHQALKRRLLQGSHIFQLQKHQLASMKDIQPPNQLGIQVTAMGNNTVNTPRLECIVPDLLHTDPPLECLVPGLLHMDPFQALRLYHRHRTIL
jgi:hypothetical protein